MTTAWNIRWLVVQIITEGNLIHQQHKLTNNLLAEKAWKTNDMEAQTRAKWPPIRHTDQQK